MSTIFEEIKMEGYQTPSEVAKKLGINYPAFMARIRKGKVKHDRIGYCIIISDEEVIRLIKVEAENVKC